MVAVMILAVLLPVMLAVAFLLGRQFHRRQYYGDQLSLVTRQHIDLFQGGQLNEALVEACKARFRDLLERGEVNAVEASLRPGVQYVVQVRALAELGTEDAGKILERQLQRRLSEDQLEQSWYWIDVANGLRSLNRQESLPHLLRCAETASEVPLGHFIAAETVCYLGIVGYLRDLDSPLGYAALRILHRAMEGLRHGIQPQLVTEARLGEIIETVWDHRPDNIHPVLVRIFRETLRLIRRGPLLAVALSPEGGERETFEWQISRMAVLEGVLGDYLEEAPDQLRKILPYAQGTLLRDILLALNELKAEAAKEILPLLAKGQISYADLAVEALTWSRNSLVGPFLRHWIYRSTTLSRRLRWRRHSFSFQSQKVPSTLPYRHILRALRGHPGEETEKILLLAAGDWKPVFRAAAISSLGWWEPVLQKQVRRQLNQALRDHHPEVRQTARAALARLGERQALNWFRQALTSENPHHVHEAIQVIATEGLTLLWPDLDRLVDSDNADVAYHAREALERLFEDMEHGDK